MAIFDFSKTENHFHGEAPQVMVSGDENSVHDNTIENSSRNNTMNTANSPKTGFEIFKIFLTQTLTVLGALLVAYLLFIFGISGQPIKSDCYFPTATHQSAAVTTNQNESKK